MKLTNTSHSFSLISILLHWFMSVMILFMFGLGLYMVELTYYDSWYKGSLDLHKSIGVILILMLFVRIIWRLMNIWPRPLTQNRWQNLMSKAVHFLLYMVMLALTSSGYMISTAEGRAVEAFDWISIPALPITLENQEDVAGDLHEIFAWLLISLVAVHALAALKHHFIEKDKTLKRMMKP